LAGRPDRDGGWLGDPARRDGTDYSADEVSPSELDRFTHYATRLLIRYTRTLMRTRADTPETRRSHHAVSQVRRVSKTLSGR